jgi:hypothetical protein
MKREKALDLVIDNLEVVEVTQGVNGYPKNLSCAITGFDTYEQAYQ